jgi:hypothetical protein
MSKMKGIIAGSIILLFIGMAFSPVTATTATPIQEEVQAISTITTQIKLAENDFVAMESLIPQLLEKMQSATSYSDLVDIVQSFINEHGRRPLLVLLLTCIIKTINFQFKLGQLRPVRKTTLVISWGVTNKFLSRGKNKFNLARPFTLWYYSGRTGIVPNSRTIIIDPRPFGVRMVSGRQVGTMMNFVGVFLHRNGAIGDNMHTFFIGWAGSIRAFDLSPFNSK